MTSESHQNDGAAANRIGDSVESAQMRTFRLPEFDLGRAGRAPDQFVGDVALRVELGRAYLHGDDVTKLSEGSVVALDSQATEPVDVYVAGVLVARGDLQKFDEMFCVSVTEVLFAGAKSRAA